MTEKVIGEIRFIETEDGFRIEVKGDKEQLKEMGWGPGMMRPRSKGMGRGRKRFWREWRRGRKHGFGPPHAGHAGHAHRAHHGCGSTHAGAKPWWGWEEGESEQSAGYEKPPKSV